VLDRRVGCDQSADAPTLAAVAQAVVEAHAILPADLERRAIVVFASGPNPDE